MKTPEQLGGQPKKSIEEIKRDIGMRGPLLKIDNCKYRENIEGKPDENYTPILNGEELEEIYSSYGLGIFKSKDGRFFFGTSHDNNNPQGLMEINEPSREDIHALHQGEQGKYGIELWNNWKNIDGSKE